MKTILALFRGKLINTFVVIGALGSLAAMELMVETLKSDPELYQRNVNVRYFCLVFAAILYRRVERMLIPSSIVYFEQVVVPARSRSLESQKINVNNSKLKFVIDNIIPSSWISRFIYILFFIVSVIDFSAK